MGFALCANDVKAAMAAMRSLLCTYKEIHPS